MAQVSTFLNNHWHALDERQSRSMRWNWTLALTFLCWVVYLFEPHWFLPIGPLRRLLTPVLMVALVIGLFNAPRKIWYWPLLVFVVLHWAHLPFAANNGFVRKQGEFVLYVYGLLLISTAALTTAQRLRPVLRMYLLQFIWYGLQGIPTGSVAWNNILNNQDSFGPLMTIGIGFAYYYGMGSRRPLGRWLGRVTAVICVVGVVASFARGAVISAALVLLMIWWRSPRKFLTLIGGLVLIAAVVIAASVMFPGGAFLAEMQTINEGTDTGTSGDRWELWKVGFKVWMRNPVFGVGPENCGIWASQNFSFGDAGGAYVNPTRLWGRSLHNVYVQLLCEGGAVGVFLLGVMIFDFFRRIRRLKRPTAREIWTRMDPSLPELGALATGLELGMYGYLASCLFYGQLYPHWFYTMLILTIVTDRLVLRGLKQVKAARSNAD